MTNAFLEDAFVSQYNANVSSPRLTHEDRNYRTGFLWGSSFLRTLLSQGHELVGVSTPPDQPIKTDPLKEVAESHGVPWVPTGGLNEEAVYSQFADWKPDLGIMAFVTDILPEKALREPRLGTIQYHPSIPAQTPRR
jgi:methionyl-tRNA formyltransferase